MFKELICKILALDNQPLLNTIEDLKIVIKVLRNNIMLKETTLLSELEVKNSLIVKLKKDVEDLELNIKDGKLEYYWNNKIKPLTVINYKARFHKNMNVLKFFTMGVNNTPIVEGISSDVKANNALIYVKNHIVYHSEGVEHWQTVDETIERELGDCIANYEMIYMKNGLKKVGDLVVGDEVLSYDFSKSKYCFKHITKIWDKGKLPLKRVHLRNGSYIDITDNHPLWVRTSQKHSNYEKTYLKDVDLTRWWKRKVPVVKKLPYKVIDLKWFSNDLCFIIGHFLAEGWHDKSGKVGSSGYDLISDIIPLLEKSNIPFTEGKNNSGVPVINFLKSGFKEYIKTLKSSSFDIHLPEQIFHLPEKKLQSLLDGFFLGDGHKAKYDLKGKYEGCKSHREKCYSTSSKRFAEDLCRISLQLGKPLYFYYQINHKSMWGSKPIYRLFYNTNSAFSRNYGYDNISEVSISFIEDLSSVEMRDFEVEDTHTFIFKNGLISHQCEDGAILMANIMLKSGVPYWRIRLNAGDVQGGGHAYVTYLREKDNKWYVLDWCYWYGDSVNFKKTWKDAKKYFGIWFSWSSKYGFMKDELDR